MMKQKTLQTQYNLIKEGKGNEEVFLKEAKRIFPNYIPNAATFNQAETILKQKSIISENIWGVATGREEKPDWFAIFNENMETINEAKSLEDIVKSTTVDGSMADLEKAVMAKAKEAGLNVTADEVEIAVEKHADMALGLFEAKAVEKKASKEVTDLEEKNFDYKDKKNIDNVYGEQFLKGYYCEMKNPKNEKKTVEELKSIVAKNLAKDQLHYVKAGQFGEEGVGYTDELPGLKASKSDQMEKVKLDEAKEPIKESNPFAKIKELERNIAKMQDKLETTASTKQFDLYQSAIEVMKDQIKDLESEVVAEEVEVVTEAKKPKKETIESKLAEIDKASNLVALEAKINAIAEMIESKSQRLEMVNEDSDLAEMMDKAKIKAIQKEIKELEKRKSKMEKLYEKSCGKKYQQQEVVGEDYDPDKEQERDEDEIPMAYDDEGLPLDETEITEEKGEFEVGEKVTYLGHPGEITSSKKDTMGRWEYSVSYDKGYGKTKVSNILNKGGEIKKA